MVPQEPAFPTHTEKERVHGSKMTLVGELASELQVRKEKVKSFGTLGRSLYHLVLGNNPQGRPLAPKLLRKRVREVFHSSTRLTQGQAVFQ